MTATTAADATSHTTTPPALSPEARLRVWWVGKGGRSEKGPSRQYSCSRCLLPIKVERKAIAAAHRTWPLDFMSREWQSGYL
jgi:hypothetical protein